MQVNLPEAKNCLPSLITAVEQGEEVILARDGVPVARLVKYGAPKVKPPGAWAGKVPYSHEWDTPETNAEIQQLFLDSNNANTA
jgi:antitoxin (DNA-binding transcriptional repressor) of toxin-antitoxin stability system